ncbi:MAG TPA: type II toxin-antitoxin system MqsR family toxin [Polyangia bacterium]|nr:type II toxin-antitoxin system MqsR family toxin [Polyangia bacterium]
MKAKTPHWPLERLKALISAGEIHIHESVYKNFSTRGEARRSVIEVCMSITTREFAETLDMTWDKADVYGVQFLGGGWYLKVAIDEVPPEAMCISFHPLKYPLRTNRGEVKP